MGLRGRTLPLHVIRQRLDWTIDLYLGDCFGRRTAARAADFAQYVEVTRQHLARQASQLGISLRDYLRRRQLQYAEQLLRTTSYSIVEIAAMSAFGTHPTFYRAFKAAYRMTPGEYRERHRQQVPK